jgi:outer membrane protein assembly factor BamA
MDVEYKHIVSHKNSSFHLRAYAGAGLALTTGSKKGEVTLPFFKSFIAGGPNSMRGWAIRKLGIGSNVFYDTVAAGTFNDKYADMQLEGNIEYRFNLFQFYGFWMRGAVFTDIGNIWFRNDLNNSLKNAGFRLDRPTGMSVVNSARNWSTPRRSSGRAARLHRFSDRAARCRRHISPRGDSVLASGKGGC